MVGTAIKLAILGMENAGKSTIVDLITNGVKDTPECPPDMNPTQGVAKNQCQLNNKKNFIVWDFGGQEMYRTDYIKYPNKYFTHISYFYFVIDSQDYNKVMSSSMYFLGVFQVMRKLSPDAKFIFLFHKIDPGFDPSSIKKVKEAFLDGVDKHLRANKLSYETFDTTIYDLDTIWKAFSRV